MSQETFLKAYNALPTFRGDSRFSTWLYRLAGNAATDLLRSRKSGRVVSLDELREDNPAFDVSEGGDGPQEELERRETQRSLDTALHQLPEDARKILALREKYDLHMKVLRFVSDDVPQADHSFIRK